MKKVQSPISRSFSFLLFVAALQFSAQVARADQWWPALGWKCNEDARHVVAYPVYFDANKPMPETGVGFYVPMKNGWDNAQEEIPVFSCKLGPSISVEVARIRLKAPSPRGVCGAGAYSDYSLSVNGEERAEFAIGCDANTFVKISENYGEICNLSSPESPCRRLEVDTYIKLNAFGHFSERPK